MSETITTITIKTNNEEVTSVKATAAPVEDKAFDDKTLEIKPNKKKKHGNRENYSVYDFNLLHKIVDAGLLEFLHGIHIADDKSKSWHFDRVPEVKSVIDIYFEHANAVAGSEERK